MSGLALVLAESQGPLAEAALELAAATAALGEPVALFLSRGSLGLLADGAGPLQMLRELGATVCVCQTSMAAQGLDAAALPDWVEPTGLVAFLKPRRDWRLLLG
jgi:intracellular sulfur oxidation DsrE/DsrF family protein